MSLREHWKDLRRRRTLSAYVSSTFATEMKNCNTPAEKEEAYQIARSITQVEQNKLEWLQQKDLIRAAWNTGIEIRPDDYEEDPWMPHKTLTYKSEPRIRRELYDLRLSRAKDLMAIFGPLLSSLIAILGLLVALKKR